MKTLKLSDEKALELYKTADSSLKKILEENWGKEFFTSKKIWEIVYDIDTLINHLCIHERDLFIFPKNTEDKHERYINSCNIIPKISEIYREGKVFNFKNLNEYKYFPYRSLSGGSFVFGSGSWSSAFTVPAGFYVDTNEKSLKMYENFKEIFEDFWNNK